MSSFRLLASLFQTAVASTFASVILLLFVFIFSGFIVPRCKWHQHLKLKTLSGFVTSQTDGSRKKLQKTATGKVETTDNFDDDVEQLEGATRNNGTLSSKLSSIISAKKKKVTSGDDDLPERDDLGERRWKHELRVLSQAEIHSTNDSVQLDNKPESLSDGGNDVDDVADDVESDGSDEEFYISIKRQRDLKLRMKKPTRCIRGRYYS